MPIDIPDFDTGTTKDWYTYFRLTAYLPAIERTFKQALSEADNPACARRIMTAYAATCIDIAMMYSGDRAIDDGFLPLVDDLFDLQPSALLHLNARDIAALTSYDDDAVCEGLKHIGFTLADDGKITGFTPTAQPPKQAPRGPKTP